MNINRAVHVLAKFFQINEDVFLKAMGPKNLGPLKKDSVLQWAQQVQEEADGYKLTRNQHCFLTGNIAGF